MKTSRCVLHSILSSPAVLSYEVGLMMYIHDSDDGCCTRHCALTRLHELDLILIFCNLHLFSQPKNQEKKERKVYPRFHS